jgi:hypothetical protein
MTRFPETEHGGTACNRAQQERAGVMPPARLLIEELGSAYVHILFVASWFSTAERALL